MGLLSAPPAALKLRPSSKLRKAVVRTGRGGIDWGDLDSSLFRCTVRRAHGANAIVMCLVACMEGGSERSPLGERSYCFTEAGNRYCLCYL